MVQGTVALAQNLESQSGIKSPASTFLQMAADIAEIKTKIDRLAVGVSPQQTIERQEPPSRGSIGDEEISEGTKQQAARISPGHSTWTLMNTSTSEASRATSAPVDHTLKHTASPVDGNSSSTVSAPGPGSRRTGTSSTSSNSKKRKGEHVYHPSPPRTRSGSQKASTPPAEVSQDSRAAFPPDDDHARPLSDNVRSSQQSSGFQPNAIANPEQCQQQKRDAGRNPADIDVRPDKTATTTRLPLDLLTSPPGEAAPAEEPIPGSESNPIEFGSSDEGASKRQKLNNGEYQSTPQRQPRLQPHSSTSTIRKKPPKKHVKSSNGPFPKMYPDGKSSSSKKKKTPLQKEPSHGTPCPKSRHSKTLTPTQSTLTNFLPTRYNDRESNAFSMFDKSSTPMSERPECPERVFSPSPSPMSQAFFEQPPTKTGEKGELLNDDESQETERIASLNEALTQKYPDVESHLHVNHGFTFGSSAMNQPESCTPRTYQTPFIDNDDSLPTSLNEAGGQGSFRWQGKGTPGPSTTPNPYAVSSYV